MASLNTCYEEEEEGKNTANLQRCIYQYTTPSVSLSKTLYLSPYCLPHKDFLGHLNTAYKTATKPFNPHTRTPTFWGKLFATKI